MQYRGIIIGFGNSGQRFYQASKLVGTSRDYINITCIVDHNPYAIERANSIPALKYLSADHALQCRDYDVAFICTNEDEHFSIFRSIYDKQNTIRLIVTEKLITETLEQATQLASAFHNDSIVVNFTERLSPVTSRLREWIMQHNLSITRASFFWGKCRIHDPRPTIGVLSELSHPLDLILHLAGINLATEFRVLSAINISSNFAPSRESILDTTNLAIEFSNGLLLTGSCSYVWDGRDRRILLYLGRRGHPTTYLAVLTFDTPYWDLDKLEIFDFRKDPECQTPVEQLVISESNLPLPRLRINKICLLLEAVLRDLDGHRGDEIARLDHAVYVQSILHAIEEHAFSPYLWRGSFK